MDVKGVDIEAQLPKGEVHLGDLKGKEGSQKDHMPKVHMPGIKIPQIPKADITALKVDITKPSKDISGPKTKTDIKIPEMEVEGGKVIGDIKLVEKEVEGKDSKFKVPKFKMPSFGVSVPSKDGIASVDVSLSKAEVDVSLPSVQGDVKADAPCMELPPVEVDIKGVEAALPGGEVQLDDLKGKAESAGFKGHLPKVHMPSIKMSKVDIKSPKVDLTLSSIDMSPSKTKIDIKSPEVDIQGVKVEGDIKLGEKEGRKDSKFKMPKFKMPSFGVSAPSKDGTSLMVPKAELDVSLPSVKGDVKADNMNMELPTVELDIKGVDTETQLPEGDIQLGELKGKAGCTDFKGHMPNIQMPQMPKVNIKSPQIDLTMPTVDVSLPKTKVDIKSPEVDVEGIKVEEDTKLKEKEGRKDSKFKMPKFKMPSFGVSAPSKDGTPSVDISFPKAEMDVTLPSFKGDVKSGDMSMDLPTVEVDVKGMNIETQLPEGVVQFGDVKEQAGSASITGVLPKVHMPSIKMSQMPKADIKSLKVDVSLPKAKVDIKSPEVEVEGISVEGDIKLGDKGVDGKDSKFKMMKFKMPSFGVSAPSKDGAESVDVSLSEVEVDVSHPASPDDIKAGELSMEQPSGEVEVKGIDSETQLPEGEIQGGGLKGKLGSASFKGHLPYAHLPSMKMPQMPKADTKGPKVDVTMPNADLSLPKTKVDFQSPELEVEGIKVERDIKLGDKDMEGKDSKFKMPPFAISAPSKDGTESVDVSLPKAEMDVSLPSVQGDMKAGDLSVELPSVEVKGVNLEGDIKLGDKEVVAKSSKFKMPKFKMPSFGSSSRRLSKSSIDSPSIHVDSEFSESSSDFANRGPELSSSYLQEFQLQKDPQLKIDGTRIKLQMSKVSLPSIDFSKSDDNVSKSNVPLGSSQPDSISSLDVSSLPTLPEAISGVCAEILSSDIPVSEIDTDKFVPQVQLSHIQLPEIDCQGLQFDVSDTKISLKNTDSIVPLSEGNALERDLNSDISFSSSSDTPERHIQFPGVTLPGFSFTKLNISGPHTESSKTRVKEDITLTKYEVTLPISESHDVPSLPQPDNISNLKEHSIQPKAAIEEPEILTGTGDERGQALPLSPAGIIKFHKFYKPKFGVSVSQPLGTFPQELSKGSTDMTTHEVLSVSPQTEIMSSETIKSSTHSSSVPSSQECSALLLTASDVPDSDIVLETVKPEVKSEGIESDGIEGFFKMPKFKLPSFSWSPKKEATPKGAPCTKPCDTSTISDKEQAISNTEAQTLCLETDVDVSTEKDGPKEKFKKSHFVMPKIGLSKTKSSKRGINLKKEAGEFTQPDDTTTEEDNKKFADTSGKKEVLDTEVVQIVIPAFVSQKEIQDPEGPTPGKITQEPSSVKEGGKDQTTLPNVLVPKLGSSVAQVKNDNIHISIPKLETSVSQLSPKTDRETVALETETYADVLKRNIDDKGLKLCPTGMLDSTVSISEVKFTPGENIRPHLTPNLGFTTSEMEVPRGETFERVFPKHDMSMPRPQTTDKGEKGIVGLPESEVYLLPTEGPVKLKTLCTEIPSQVSVIETGRVWEGSVLTVKFPKLQVPKFTFQAPSTDADIFIPNVREIMCSETDIEIAIHKESPEEWSAKVLKAVPEVPPQPSSDLIRPPKNLALSSVVSPISKVKVHIQGAHIESQEVTVESRVTCEHGELPRRETFSTQIVRASEIPPSDTQTPSYGFSLLKVKIPESHGNLDGTDKEQETLSYTSSAIKTQDISEDSLRKDESGVDTVDLSLEGELQPETGEPYEIISSSASLPKLKTFTFEVHSSHQYVDSYSDEEPAEILEFPPEDSYGQDEEEKEQKVQPEPKKSGLFRFWLPNIGFSSSVDETSSDSKTEVSKSVPIETQPEAMPDIEPPKKPEKTSWFRFPKLGFSSSPTKKSKSIEESGSEPTKTALQEEAEQTVIFFDAQETLSPEEIQEDESVTSTANDDVQEPSALVTSSARTELILLEEEGKVAGKTSSGNVTK